ncbi:MAG: hypothetical protein U0802_10600 [Candidatus Binatia bacterium]
MQLKTFFGNDTSGDCDSCEDVYTVQLLTEDGTEIAREDANLFGAATFSDLAFDTPGTYRLTARRVLNNAASSRSSRHGRARSSSAPRPRRRRRPRRRAPLPRRRP